MWLFQVIQCLKERTYFRTLTRLFVISQITRDFKGMDIVLFSVLIFWRLSFNIVTETFPKTSTKIHTVVRTQHSVEGLLSYSIQGDPCRNYFRTGCFKRAASPFRLVSAGYGLVLVSFGLLQSRLKQMWNKFGAVQWSKCKHLCRYHVVE